MEPARKQENSYEEEIDEENIPTLAVVCCICVYGFGIYVCIN